MVALVGSGLATTLTTALAQGGAKTIKVVPDAPGAERAAKQFIHPAQVPAQYGRRAATTLYLLVHVLVESLHSPE